MLTSDSGDRGRGAGLVRRIYVIRLVGYVMGLPPILLQLHAQHAGAWLRASVWAICLIWPHVAYLQAKRAAQPIVRERVNLVCDSAWGGWLAVAIQFAPIGTIVILLMFALDNMAVGGWRLFLAGTLASACAVFLGVLILGAPSVLVRAESYIDFAWLPVAVVYPLVLAKTTHDVSAKLIERSARLRELSERDSLTGLVNRGTVAGSLQALLAGAEGAQERISVLFIDLDGFKTVNDALGHNVGDELLVKMAERLAACAHDDEIVARYGGDEFVIVARHSKEDGADRRSTLSEAVLQAMSKPIDVGGHELLLGASIGVSSFPDDGRDAAGLLHSADIAMYAAKNRGRNCYELYQPRMRAEADARLRLSARLRKAIESGGLHLHYQPQVDMRTGELRGLEALVRWHDVDFGEIQPSDFIAVAETAGLVSHLGEWVLGAACAQVVAWQRLGVRVPRISVNVSPLQLQRADVVETFERILNETRIEPACVELEVTETALMRQPETAARRLGEFRRAGITIAIDDFGMGYSSLGQLRKLPIDRIKIDRAFVEGIGAGDSGAIATAIVTLAKTLGLAVIAEGVETAAQRDFLLSLGCFDAQGYLYSKPLDVDAATRLLVDGGTLPQLGDAPCGGKGRIVV
ncbi:EAL domain-containing protein [Paraburkholderia sp. NMBU_R16]|uniref:putative bifunctional diguanylate cyclase/phosphodiesterase n=1 Tax=Paraburkholderia sp. NMBU_R16 TaxID=2698676 RepID=UPI001565C679|nr:EAL domain-containing protein [Paraburkholderia sp. NMBU_R16]